MKSSKPVGKKLTNLAIFVATKIFTIIFYYCSITKPNKILHVKSLLLFPLLFISLFVVSQNMVPGGTIVSITLNKDVFAPDVKIGDPADFTVLQDVMVGGKVVIPAHSKARATVIETTKSGPHHGEGSLKVQIYDVKAVDGSTVTFDDCFVFTTGDGGHKQRGSLLVKGIGKNCVTKR